jgi:Ni/Fe-hydrogenase subunit HybB-like protein
MAKAAGETYFPSAAELFLSIGLVSVGILVYLFIVENFDVFPEHHEHLSARENSDKEQASPEGAGLARA